eukprot:122927-Hanusia_phi.AAC.5
MTDCISLANEELIRGNFIATNWNDFQKLLSRHLALCPEVTSVCFRFRGKGRPMNELQELYKKYKSYVLREESSPVQTKETQHDKACTAQFPREREPAGVEGNSVAKTTQDQTSNSLKQDNDVDDSIDASVNGLLLLSTSDEMARNDLG